MYPPSIRLIKRCRDQHWRFGTDYGLLNVLFFVTGVTLLGTGLVQVTGHAANAAMGRVRQIVFPYTTEGKLQLCTDNLHLLGRAVIMYQQDYDGRYPPISIPSAVNRQVGWPDLVIDRVGGEDAARRFQCPTKQVHFDGGSTPTSYGLSTILAGSAPEYDELHYSATESQVAMLADRGEADPLAMFSIYESSFNGSSPVSNIDFRHDARANLMYSDGHVATLSHPKQLNDPTLWYSEFGVSKVGNRLIDATPIFKAIEQAAKNGDESSGHKAIALDIPEAVRSLTNFELLWNANVGDGADPRIETIGWTGAQLLSEAGHPEINSRLIAEQSKRSLTELRFAQDISMSRSNSGNGFSLETPASWEQTREGSDNYEQFYFRSHSPYIYVMVERGRGTQSASRSTISWSGVDSRLKSRYGARYLRRGFGTGTLAGLPATSIEYEVERIGEPKLRMHILGIKQGLNSYSIKCAAPAADFTAWQSLFDIVRQSFRTE